MVLSSTTLVNVSEDAELRLVSLLADAAPSDLLASTFRDKCSSSISEGDASGLLQTILQDPGAIAALTVLPSDQVMAAVSILAALLQRLETNTLAQSLADAVTATKASAERKIHILSILYNMRPDVKEKCALLAKMIRLAGEASEADASRLLAEDSTLGRLLVSDNTSFSSSSAAAAALDTSQHVPRIVTWLDSWQVPAADRRELYQLITEVVPSRKQRFLLLLCETYSSDSSSTSSSPEALQAAKQATIGAIQDPMTHFSEQRHLLQLAAGLKQSEPFLYDLLRVFQQGKIADYQKLATGKESALTGLGLDHEQCSKYMRILSLCSLAAEHEEIPYQVIADTLLVDKSDVESWVIAAVNSGLLQTKMDQLKESVMVERCVVRQFDDPAQWKALQSRLQVWKQNVGDILETLKQTQAQVVASSTATATTSQEPSTVTI